MSSDDHIFYAMYAQLNVNVFLSETFFVQGQLSSSSVNGLTCFDVGAPVSGSYPKFVAP